MSLSFHIWIGPLCLPKKQNNRIILSCLSDIRVLGSFAQHPMVHPFYSPQDSLKSTFFLKPLFKQARKLHPIDLLIWWGTQEGVPLDLSDIPVPKAWVISDWYNHWPILDFSRHFNWVFCDQRLKEVLTPKTSSQTQVIYRSNYAFVPQLIPPEDKTRDIDILFVGSTLAQKYRQRNKYLLRLAQMNTFKTHFAQGLTEQAYLSLLTRSKIAFNHALRQEMNLRAYEAAACGAALMMSEDNREVDLFLYPDQEYIPYNAENLETKIEYYLKHDSKRIALAQRAKATLSLHNYEYKFRTLVEFLQTQMPFPKALTPIHTDLSGILLGVTSDRFSWKKLTPNYLRSHLPKIPTPQDWKKLNALLVTQAEQHLLFSTSKNPSKSSDLQHTQAQVLRFLKTHQYFLQKQSAINTLLHHNLAWSFLYQQENASCAQSLAHIHPNQMQTLPPLLREHFFILPTHYLGFQLLYQEAAYSDEVLLTEILKASLFFLQGKLFNHQKLFTQAIQAFENCLQHCSLIIEAYFELAALFKNMGQADKAEQCLAYGLNEGIFYPKMWKAYFSLIKQRSLSCEEEQKLQYLKTVLSRLPLFES